MPGTRAIRHLAFLTALGASLIVLPVRADFCLNGPGSHNQDTDGDVADRAELGRRRLGGGIRIVHWSLLSCLTRIRARG